MNWSRQVSPVACDVHSSNVAAVLSCRPDVLVHLAWPGLPNYDMPFHVEQNLPADSLFLRSMIESGVKHILVTGTGAEYGLGSGVLGELAPTEPVNAYGIAKDCLRRYLQFLQKKEKFTLQWVRLFHMHGVGQNPKSVLAQLDVAIDRGASSFDMSGGEQLRDYLPIVEVARRLSVLVDHPECNGIINCCSGTPISVRQLVEDRIRERGSSIKPNFGVFPYPDYESMAYWGSSDKFSALHGTKPG